MAKRFVDLIGLQSCTGFNTPTWLTQIGESSTPNFVQGTNLISLTDQYNVPIDVVNTDTLLIRFTKIDANNNSIYGWYKNGNTQQLILSVTVGWNPMPFLGLGVVIDDDTHEGGFWYCMNYRQYGSDRYYVNYNSIKLTSGNKDQQQLYLRMCENLLR